MEFQKELVNAIPDFSKTLLSTFRMLSIFTEQLGYSVVKLWDSIAVAQFSQVYGGFSSD